MHYIMSDLHGCFDEFMKLKTKIETKDDEAVIIIAGDILDRGTQTRELLEWCMSHTNRQDGKYYLMMGNHEDLAIGWYDTLFVPWIEKRHHRGEHSRLPETVYDFDDLILRNHWESRKIMNPIIDFLRKLPYCMSFQVAQKHFLIAHAWAPGKQAMDEIRAGRRITRQEKEIFLWERRDEEAYEDQDTILIHGHTPTLDLNSGKKAAVFRNQNVINIDCGCVYHALYGRLAALCLETEEEIYS